MPCSLASPSISCPKVLSQVSCTYSSWDSALQGRQQDTVGRCRHVAANLEMLSIVEKLSILYGFGIINSLCSCVPLGGLALQMESPWILSCSQFSQVVLQVSQSDSTSLQPEVRSDSLSQGSKLAYDLGDCFVLCVWVLALQASPDILLEGCTAVQTV